MATHAVKSRSWFTRFAKSTSRAAGHPVVFCAAAAVILLWAVSGPLFGFSDTWQLVINTGTTIVTFLMVFLIQNTQNRDSVAIQVKLDELIRSIEGAHLASPTRMFGKWVGRAQKKRGDEGTHAAHVKMVSAVRSASLRSPSIY